MKKLKTTIYFCAISFLVLLNSCGNEPVLHTKETPFIIGKIEKVDDNLWRYGRQEWNVDIDNILSTGKQSITTDEDLNYKIGDTLRLKYK